MHTPLQVVEDKHPHADYYEAHPFMVMTGTGEIVCRTHLRTDAEFIVQAVNSHAKLLEALKTAKSHCLALNHPIFPTLKLTERCPFCTTAADAIDEAEE